MRTDEDNMTTEIKLHTDATELHWALDLSGSMQNCDAPGSVSRLHYARQRLEAVLEMLDAAAPGYSATVYGFGTQLQTLPAVGMQRLYRVRELRADQSHTRTHEVVFAAHAAAEHAPKPVLLVLCTDGAPTGRAACAAALRLACEADLAVWVLTVGEASLELRQWLDKLRDLHEGLQVGRLEDVVFSCGRQAQQAPAVSPAPAPAGEAAEVAAPPAQAPAGANRARVRRTL
jgi:hypothetical protein